MRRTRSVPGHNVTMTELTADPFVSLDGFAAGVDVGPLLGEAGLEPAYAGYSRAGLELTGTRVLDSRIVMPDYRPGTSAT
jgi:hypothetical protein